MTRLLKIALTLAIGLAMFEAVLPTVQKVRLVELYIIIIFLLWFVSRGVKIPSNTFSYCLLFFSIYSIVIGAVAYLVGGKSDTFLVGMAPSVRTLLYSSLFFIFYDAFSTSEYYIKNILIFVVLALVLNSLYGAIQFAAIWTSYIQVESLPHWGYTEGQDIIMYAPSGITDTPYAMASYAMILLILGLSFKLSGYLGNTASWVVIAVAIIGLLAATRRNQIIASVVVSILMVAISNIRTSKKATSYVLFGVCVSLPFVFVDSIEKLSPYVAGRIQSLADLASGNLNSEKLNTLNEGRIQGTWSDYLNLISENPLGTGYYPPNVLNLASDSAILTYTAWGGPIMLVVYLSIISSIVYMSYKCLVVSRGHKTYELFGYIGIGIAMGEFIISIAGGGVFSLPSKVLVWFTAAIVSAFTKKA